MSCLEGCSYGEWRGMSICELCGSVHKEIGDLSSEKESVLGQAKSKEEVHTVIWCAEGCCKETS